jgi:hypothetical protein
LLSSSLLAFPGDDFSKILAEEKLDEVIRTDVKYDQIKLLRKSSTEMMIFYLQTHTSHDRCKWMTTKLSQQSLNILYHRDHMYQEEMASM